MSAPLHMEQLCSHTEESPRLLHRVHLLPGNPSLWWIPEPVASLNSGFQILSCQVQVLSRPLFSNLIILSIAYLLLLHLTVLLLGVACGFVGKLCMDTLGGSGYY